jgi:hypothetical protein
VRTITFPIGTVTSIGSLPHRDREAAVAFVLDRTPGLPASPSLPALEPREGMLAQAAWGIRGVTVGQDGTLGVDPARLDPDAPLGDRCMAGVPFATQRAFLTAVAARTAPIKLQLTGPVTLGLALRAAGADADVAFAVASRAVRARAHQLIARARASVPAAPLVVFVDEPGLVDGLSPGGSLGAERAIDLVSGALAAIEPHAVSGVHCCGRTDWRVLLQAGPHVLSLPAGAGIDGSAGALAGFLERGGYVAWGAVPTDGPVGESAARLWRVLSTQWRELVQAGCDPSRLRRQALVTPVCGLALHDEGHADQVFALTSAVARRLHDQLFGVDLSVGA